MAILLVNFGGPRHLGEIEPFLKELLCDRELIRTRFPKFFHNFLFSKIAKKRAPKIRPDYELIGGKSPIYETTEAIAEELRAQLQVPIYTFHRYLSSTHKDSLFALEKCTEKEIRVFPFFPQFSYATTGSIATILRKHLSKQTLAKLRWIRSYPNHASFIHAWTNEILTYLQTNNLRESDTAFLFSAHGVPQSFVDQGDSYENECNASFKAILSAFPDAIGKLAYQSKFGRGEWLRPYTQDAAEEALLWHQGRRHIVFIPLAFTSDHIETLFEIQQLYLPIIAAKGLFAHRCPALNLSPSWIQAIPEILDTNPLFSTAQLCR